MLGISGWDWFTLALYGVGIVIIGIWTALRTRDREDFFIGGRRFGKLMMVFFSFGAGTNGNQAVAVASATYKNGMSGIWFQWLWLFATPFYWLIAPIFRRMRAVTTGDYFDMRYDRSVGALYSVAGILQLSANMGVMLLGAGTVITAVSGGEIPVRFAIPILTVLFVFYGVAGGLSAAILTDFIQGILTVLLSFMVLPFAFQAVSEKAGGIGGMAGLHKLIDNPAFFRIARSGEITTFFIIMLATNATLGIVCQPHTMGTCAAGRNEMDGRVGFAGGNLLKRICTVAWMMTGMCALVLYPNLTDKGAIDQTYGLMARDLLPMILPGLVGIFLASLLASVMSSCDAFMVACSGLFTQNIYKRFLMPGKTEKHYVNVGRVASVVIVAMALGFSYAFTDVVEGLKVFWKLTAITAAAFWVGLFWRRATPAGAWAGSLVTFGILALTEWKGFDAIAVKYLPDFMIYEGQFLESWQILFYLTAGFAAIIVVSLFTKRVPRERLDQLYACLNTPVGENEPHLEPFTLPEGVEPGKPNKLIGHPDLEIPKPSLVGMGGFLVFWGLVVLMIGFVYWLAGVGAEAAL